MRGRFGPGLFAQRVGDQSPAGCQSWGGRAFLLAELAQLTPELDAEVTPSTEQAGKSDIAAGSQPAEL